MFYNQAKKEAIKKLEAAEKEYNSIGQQGNQLALDLYASRKSAAKAIDRIESYINALANSPKEPTLKSKAFIIVNKSLIHADFWNIFCTFTSSIKQQDDV